MTILQVVNPINRTITGIETLHKKEDYQQELSINRTITGIETGTLLAWLVLVAAINRTITGIETHLKKINNPIITHY